MNGILLIAQQPDVVKSFTEMLSPAYEVHCVATPDAGKEMLSEKHQKAAMVAALIAALIAAVFVISQVGIWILNIRYSAAVLNAAIGVMAVAQLIMFAAERRSEKETVIG